MNVDNFLVRPQRRLVEQYREPAGWEGLDLDRATELAAGVADLPSAVRDDDEEAKRFDLIILRLQLCRLRGGAGAGAASPPGPGDRRRAAGAARDPRDP